ncbi:hypothetical protein [Acinetobacter stercoris]|nr:hypothetical protein [Acinetobacter stercoris]
MKKLLQGAVLPFVIFTSGVLLLGCDQAQDHRSDQTQAEDQQSRDDSYSSNEQVNSKDDPADNHTSVRSDLKSGNMFYIARDVADMQLKTGDYVRKLEQTQNDLQQAIESKDQHQLQKTATNLRYQLQGFSDALNALNLKSEEIDSIRGQVLRANKQVLDSPFLNGSTDFSKINFEKIEQQMNTIQSDMLKLAAMLTMGKSSDQQGDDDSDQ